MRCASYGGGSVAHAHSYARIDGRDQAIMTRHINPQAPQPSLQSLPLLARDCWQTGEPSAANTSSHVIRTFYTAPSSQPLLIPPRTLDPISFSPLLVPTPFPLQKHHRTLGPLLPQSVCAFPLFSQRNPQCQNKTQIVLNSGTPRRQGKPTPRPCVLQQQPPSLAAPHLRVWITTASHPLRIISQRSSLTSCALGQLP